MCQRCIDHNKFIEDSAEQFYQRAGQNLDNALYDIYTLLKGTDSAHRMKMYLYQKYDQNKYSEELRKAIEQLQRLKEQPNPFGLEFN
jgi:hypothetical protein